MLITALPAGKHQLIYCFCSTVKSLFLIYPCSFLIYPCSFLIYPKFNGRSETNMGRSKTNMGRSETNMGRSKTNMGRSKTKSAWTHSLFLIYLMQSRIRLGSSFLIYLMQIKNEVELDWQFAFDLPYVEQNMTEYDMSRILIYHVQIINEV